MYTAPQTSYSPYGHHFPLRIKLGEANPYWEGAKAFLSQFAEPFSGAAHYWTGGRIGSDYAPDSPWQDTVNRVYNALPGKNQAPLKYKDPLLDAAAASLGVSGLAAGAAALAPAVPHAGAFLTAARGARHAVPAATRAGQLFKAVATPTVALTTPKVVGDAIRVGAPAIQSINRHQDEAKQYFLNQGYAPEDADRMSHKVGWGGVLQAGKEYISNPYHYIYRQGGHNPIDSRFASSMGSPKPHGAFNALREGASVLSSGPLGVPIKTLGYGAINQLESIPGALQTLMTETQRQMPSATALASRALRPVQDAAQNAINNSRLYNSMKKYYGDDIYPIMSQMYARSNPPASNNPRSTIQRVSMRPQ